MAQVTIVLTDDDSGSVNIANDFDPPLDMTSDQPMTNAQTLAFGLLDDMAKGENFMDKLARGTTQKE